MVEVHNEKQGSKGGDSERGLEVSPANIIKDEICEEKLKGADAVFRHQGIITEYNWRIQS